jgi:S1-C subfamily serine protease
MDEINETPETGGDDGEHGGGPSPFAAPGSGEWMPPPPVPPGAGGWSPQPPSSWPAGGGSGWRDPSSWGQTNPYGAPAGGNPYGSPYSGESPGWGPPGGTWQYGWPGGPPPQPRPRRTLPSVVTALLLVVAVLVGLGIGHGVWNHAGSVSSGGSSQDPFGSGSGTGNGSGTGPATSSVAAEVSPALVDINTQLSYQRDAASGTGIVLSANGLVLTNNHVIEGATTISVTDIGNGKTYRGEVLGYDRTHDVALVQMEGASGLATAKIGDSGKVAVGDGVIGLGNAGGVNGPPSAASGAVTALNQSITADDDSNGTTEQLNGLIETDANIQPGDSGGALVNSSGQVIGVDTAASSGFSFENQGGQGFAIPIDEALSIANQIRSGQANATVHIGPTAFLGVLVDTTGNGSGQSGAALSQVVAGGPADKAGLTGGDTITSLANTSVASSNSLTQIIDRYHPGDSVEIGWVDTTGQTHQGAVQLATGPAQ